MSDEKLVSNKIEDVTVLLSLPNVVSEQLLKEGMSNDIDFVMDTINEHQGGDSLLSRYVYSHIADKYNLPKENIRMKTIPTEIFGINIFATFDVIFETVTDKNLYKIRNPTNYQKLLHKESVFTNPDYMPYDDLTGKEDGN